MLSGSRSLKLFSDLYIIKIEIKFPLQPSNRNLGHPWQDDEDDYEELDEEGEGVERRNCILACADRSADFLFNAFEWFLDRRFGPIEEMNFYKNTTEHLWKVDHASQVAFPVVFALLQTLYWTMYLYMPSTVEFRCDNVLSA